MSRGSRNIVVISILFLTILSLASASELPPKQPQQISQDSNKSNPLESLSEDEWILRAIWLEENRAFSQSAEVYAKLYEATKKKEYLFKEVSGRIYSGRDIGRGLKKLKNWTAKHPLDLAGQRVLLALYMNESLFDEAAKVGTDLLKHSKQDADLELAANPYIYTGNYQKASELLSKLYDKTNNEKVLLKIAAIDAQYLKKPKEAIRLLETHRRIKNSSTDLYKMLIDLYVKEQNIDQILVIYKALYEKEPKREHLVKIIEIYVYNRDFNSLITFLESNHANDEILFDLYKKESRLNKAKKLTELLYEKDHNPKWIAERAILTYETSVDKNDTKMLDETIRLFDQAFAMGVDDSIYLNYYGYTLIDKEIDIDKGIRIVGKALKQQPKNSYYLDSLAWGYYKKNECLKAYTIMEKVVRREGLDEPEIKEHWEKIQDCQKPIIVGKR